MTGTPLHSVHVDGGHRPRSAGDGVVRDVLFNGGTRRQDSSSLESGVIGVPPPILRRIGTFTAAEVERILAERDKELLAVKRRFHRVSKRNEVLDATVSTLEGEVSKLRAAAEKKTAEIGTLKTRVTEVELSANRKASSLRSANERSRKAVEEAKADAEKTRRRLRQVEEALCNKAAGSASFARRAVDAEAQVIELGKMLRDARQRVAEANDMAAAELAGRISAQEQGRAMLEKASFAHENETKALQQALEDAYDGLRQKREAELETNKVVAGLQAWRERVSQGEIIELSSAEVRRLRWAEEQGELAKENNASLRLQLGETGRLLTEAEHSFDTVKRGCGDAAGTINDLSERLATKEKELAEAEKGLKASRVEADRLKKCVASVQLGLSEARRTVKGRERALDVTKKGIEALVRARQSEMDAKAKETRKRVAAEAKAALATADQESLQRRVESAEGCIQEMHTERRVLLQYLAAARQDMAAMREGARSASSSPPSTTGMAGGGENTDARARWRETTRSLLERAVSDWSAKTLLRRSRKEQQPRQTAAAAAAAAQRSVAKSTDDVDFIEEDSSTESGMGLNCLEPSEGEEGGMRVPGESTPVGFHGGISTMVDGITRSFSSIGEIDTPRLEVVRSYSSPKGRGNDRDVGWCWDLSFIRGNGSGDDFVTSFGLETLGKSLRELGVSGEGTKTVLVAAVRMFDTVVLVRNLAAKQCAEVRAELAGAVARLSSRAALASESREMARRASTCNTTLLIRLVDLELRCWHEKTVGERSASKGRGEDEGGTHPHTSPVRSAVKHDSPSNAAPVSSFVEGSDPDSNDDIDRQTTSAASSTNRNQEDDDRDSTKERMSHLGRRATSPNRNQDEDGSDSVNKRTYHLRRHRGEEERDSTNEPMPNLRRRATGPNPKQGVDSHDSTGERASHLGRRTTTTNRNQDEDGRDSTRERKATSPNRNQDRHDRDNTGKRISHQRQNQDEGRDSAGEGTSHVRYRLGDVERTRCSPPPLTTAGVTLNLSNLGLSDEALHLVVQMLLRRCSFHQPKTARTNKNPPCMGTKTGGSGPVPSSPSKVKAGVPERQGMRDDEGVTLSSVTQNPSVDDRGASLLPTGDGDRRTRVDDDRKTRVAIVPLSRLILSGNCLTDAGASALAPLVQASHSLEEVDLRGNCIGKKGKLALKKSLASNPWVHSVTVEDTRSSSISEGNRGEMSRGVVLRAKRRPRTTSGDRAKAYAFETIPPSPKLGRGRYTTTTTTTTTTTATIVGKLTEIFPESVSPFRATRSSDERKVEEGSTDSRARFRATRSSSDGNIETRCNANDDDHAPAVHGEESSSALNRASREQAFGRLHGNNLRLVSGGVGGAAMDSCGENVAVIAASCKIDLRGCSRWQPLSFGAIDVPFGAIASPFGKIARPIGALDESGYPPRVLHSFQDTPSAAVHPPMHALQETPSPVVRRGQRFQPLSFGRGAAAEGVSRSRVHWSQEEDTPSVVRDESDRLTSEGRRGGCLRRVDVSRADVISRSRRRKINPELERAVQRSSPSTDWFAGTSTRVPLGDQVADTLTSIGSVKAVRLQRQRRGQRQRREGDRQPAKSENQDADDLKSLLTASHRIFNEIEGHCQERAPPAATKDEGAPFDVVEDVCENRTSQHHGPAYATTLSPPVKKRGTGGVVEHGTTRDAAVRANRNHHQHHDHHRPVDAIPITLNTRGVVGIAGERNKLDADVDANKTSHHDGRTDAIPIAINNRGADGVARAGSKQLGAVVRKNITSYHPIYDALPTTDGGAGRKPCAVVRGNGNSHCRGPADATALTRSAGKRDADSARGQPPPQTTGFTGTGGTHCSIGKKITNDPPSAEKLAEDDFHSGYSHENYGSDHDGGWVYDEATGSWTYSNANEVAPAPATAPSDKACDDAGGNADDDGWRYDEHRAAWYYEEPATVSLKTISDPQEEQHQEVTQQQAHCERNKDVLQHQAAPEAVTDGIGPGSTASVGGARVAAAEGGSRGSTACVGARVSGDRGNTAAAAGAAVAGKWHGGARSQPSSRKSLRKARFGTASRALLFGTDVEGPGSTKVLHGTGDGGDGNDEVGGVVAERIKALQLALKAKP